MSIRILLIHNGYPTRDNPHYCTWIKSIEQCLVRAEFVTDKVVLNVDSSHTFGKLVCYAKYYWALLTCDLSAYDWVYIHSPNFSFPILLRTDWRRMAVHWHGSVMFPKNAIQKVLSFIAVKLTRNAKIHIVPSAYFAEIVMDRVKPTYRTHISPSGGVDLNVFIRSENPRMNVLRVGFASALNQEKGFDRYVDLIAKKMELEAAVNRSIEFYAIDYGCDGSVGRADIERTDLKLVKPMSKSEMPRYFNGIDIMFFGSRRRDESLGLVCLEAMACNVPVLANDFAAMPEYIESLISGELFQLDSLSDCLSKFIFMANNLEKYRPRTIAEKYSMESVTKDYVTILNVKVD